MSSNVNNLLAVIDGERIKKQTVEDEDFVVVQQITNIWPEVFKLYFISENTRLPQTTSDAVSDDDLVFYVRRQFDENSQTTTQNVEAFRHHDIKRQPKPGSTRYDWEETIYLNIVLHQFEYIVTAAVCQKPNNDRLKMMKRASTRVYATPSHRDMKGKGTEEKISYPSIYFSVDNFEDIFSTMYLSEGERFLVEMIATNPNVSEKKVIFSGALTFEALQMIYADRAGKSFKNNQKYSSSERNNERVEFFRLRGPDGKGHAQIAISCCQMKGKEKFPSKKSTKNPTSTEDSSARNFDGHSEEQHPQESLQQTSKIKRAASMGNLSASQYETKDETAGFLGGKLNRAINWMRGSRSSSEEKRKRFALRVAVTFLRIPCQSIIDELLHPTTRIVISK